MNGSPRFDTAVEQGRDGGCAAVDSFIDRWGASSGAERANYQLFLAELCDVLVALNHERAAEEKRGLIRWLRPDFQNKGGSNVVQREIDVADDDGDSRPTLQ